MMIRMFLFLVGFGLSVAGGITIVAYLNILTTGVGFSQYFLFMQQRPETYFFIIGMVLMALTLYFPQRR